MSRESQFAERMRADDDLMALLTGGVYEAGQLGVAGISRDVTATKPAFDAKGRLLPVAVVRQRDPVPDGAIHEPDSQIYSAAQVVEIYLYQDTGYDKIDEALRRIYGLFQHRTLPGTVAVEFANQLNRLRDSGALNSNPMARIDFQVRYLMRTS